MRWSRAFLPVLKESPGDAQIVSHKLMLRAGLVRQTAAGIYAWLPIGYRVLKKIEQIVREEQDRAGAQEMLMPTLQSADYWRATGRYDAYGPEMLRIRDRQDRELVYGPTNEDMLTAILQGSIKSYRDLPRILYHIQWKFRDEIRPRFGVMRGREFLMKDAYSFDLDETEARLSYNKMFVAYLRTFARIGLRAIPMQADTGPIGGNLSHEFIVLAPTGESEVFYDAELLKEDRLEELMRMFVEDADDEIGAYDQVIAHYTTRYAATSEKRDEHSEAFTAATSVLEQSRGIEVGHIFYFGDKYTKPLRFTVSGQGGEPVTPVGGSYGIGVSRLVGAIIEASHDDDGIIWPEPVAPWKVGIVTMRADDEASVVAAEALYAQLLGADVEVLYDDRDERGGVKLSSMDLIGLPWQIIVGPRGIASGTVELKRRSTGEREELSLESAVARLTE